MPNTFFMQELSRMSHDYYLDAIEEGKAPEDPHYLCLPKGKKTGFLIKYARSNKLLGTSIPSSLILFRERNEIFSLQPSLQCP